MKNFSKRREQHDNIAIPLVTKLFKAYQFDKHRWGFEFDKQVTKTSLSSQHDKTSMLLRYRPDVVFTKIGWRSVLCEIKSENQGYKNFAVELESWLATKEWNLHQNHVMYAFVDIVPKKVLCCWANTIPLPGIVYLPKTPDFTKTKNRIKANLPHLVITLTKYSSGSGTPYFLLPKNSKYLIKFDEFINTELLPNSLNPRCPIELTYTTLGYKLTFEYNEDLTHDIKQLPSNIRQYNRTEGCWIIDKLYISYIIDRIYEYYKIDMSYITKE